MGERGALAREGWPVQMLLTVHDERVLESPLQLAEEVGAALKQEMEGVYALSEPREVDIGIADNWAEAKPQRLAPISRRRRW